MKGLWEALQLAIAGIGGYTGWLLGGWDGFLYALVAFIAIDYMSGLVLAVLEKKLSSSVGFRGILKKLFIFAIVAVANIIDSNIIGNGSAIRTAVIFFYASNEGISILENAARMGLPIPERIREVLQQLNKEDAR